MKFIRTAKGRSSRILRDEFAFLKTRLPTLWTNSCLYHQLVVHRLKLSSGALKINKLANDLSKNKNRKTMLLTYKYKLYKTKKTKHIDEVINIACHIYNHCIALHKRYHTL